MSIIQAIIDHDLQTLTWLLINRADPNYIEDDAGLTPLHYAASEGLYEAALILLTVGAKLTAEKIFNMTPIEIAQMNKQINLVTLFKQLIPNGFNIMH